MPEQPEPKPLASTLPLVSVVIPCYNEEILIDRTIRDVLAQDYQGKVEIVISDNNSKDNTVKIASRHPVKIVHELRKGTRFNYDTGMRAATGDIIILTNADVILPPDWVSSIVAAYQDPQVAGVGTRVAFHSAPWYVNFILRALDTVNPKRSMWGPSLSSRRDAFYTVGGMDHGASLNEDAVFSLKLEGVGKVVILKQPIVLMDGRRYNNGLLAAAKEWWSGMGRNSLKVLFRYLTTGKAESHQDSFTDYRNGDIVPPPNKADDSH